MHLCWTATTAKSCYPTVLGQWGKQQQLVLSLRSVPTARATTTQREESVTSSAAAARRLRVAALEPIHEDFGMDVVGIDLKGGVTKEEFEFIKAALDKHHLLRFRNEKELEPEDERKFLFNFPHLPEEELLSYSARNYPFFKTIPGYPFLSVKAENVSLENYHGMDIERGVLPAYIGKTKRFHIDFSREQSPTEYSYMSMKMAPASGGQTEFVSAVKAYSRLTDEQKQVADGLRVEYPSKSQAYKIYRNPDVSDFYREDGLGFSNIEELRKVLDLDGEDAWASPPLPFVVEDPVTGEKSITATFGKFLKFEGMSCEDSVELLEELLAPAVAPERVWKADWRPNDVIIWKNRQMLHAIPLLKPYENQPRLLHFVFWGCANPIEAWGKP